ncbi:tgtA [Acrasis kona]|uniref:TgtA n=1 Tax=Acrasis kona TaxID=1008807 RepID=A0AAW2YL49_9EUKA
MTDVHLVVKDVPAEEGEPFQLFIDEVLVYEDTTGTADDEVTVKVEQKGFARAHNIKLRIKIDKNHLNSVQQFNVTDNGTYIGIFSDQGRLKVMQRHDGNFSIKPKEATMISANPKNFRTVKKEEHKAQGFVVNPITGEKRVMSPSSPQKTAAPTDAPSNTGERNYLEELEMLASLRDKGILTDEEFTAKKIQILGL